MSLSGQVSNLSSLASPAARASNLAADNKAGVRTQATLAGRTSINGAEASDSDSEQMDVTDEEDLGEEIYVQPLRDPNEFDRDDDARLTAMGRAWIQSAIEWMIVTDQLSDVFEQPAFRRVIHAAQRHGAAMRGEVLDGEDEIVEKDDSDGDDADTDGHEDSDEDAIAETDDEIEDDEDEDAIGETDDEIEDDEDED